MLDIVLLKWLCLLLIGSSWRMVQSFNLDPRIPVIKTGGAHSDSYFGYSVAQHRTVKGSRGVPLILVGAPQDHNLQPGTRRSGALWQCQLNNDIQVGTSEIFDEANIRKIFPIQYIFGRYIFFQNETDMLLLCSRISPVCSSTV